MVELLASNQRTRVRFPLAAPRFVEYRLVSENGFVSPRDFGYDLVPVYLCYTNSLKHKNNIEWIEESLTDKWTWFAFGGHPEPGITYCFKSKIDAGIFILCKGEPLTSVSDR